MTRLLNLSPRARRALGPEEVERLLSAVPSGVTLNLVQSQRLWTAIVFIPGTKPTYVRSRDIHAAVREALGVIARALPGAVS